MLNPGLTRAAYQAQHVALRATLALAHAGIRVFAPRKQLPTQRELWELRSRLVALHERDLENVERGAYPRELLFQLPLRDYGRRVPELSREVRRMLRRAQQGITRDFASDVDLSRYPEYFRRNFHWQSDGYLSRRSAELYDLGVEFLFLGTGDVMRRQVIPPISELITEQPGEKRVLDVGCGTGRLLYQLGIAHPEHRYFGVDLSPYYLETAGELLRGRGVSLVIDNGEALPFRDGSFDAVTSVFLFHELPRRARQNVLREMRRVLAPSGLLVLADAEQLHSAPGLAVFLESFAGEMNEPFFAQYIAEPLEADLELTGFRVQKSEPAFLSRVVVARPV